VTTASDAVQLEPEFGCIARLQTATRGVRGVQVRYRQRRRRELRQYQSYCSRYFCTTRRAMKLSVRVTQKSKQAERKRGQRLGAVELLITDQQV
jgi:hypothetical protein